MSPCHFCCPQETPESCSDLDTPGISERPVGGATKFYHLDALGSVAATTNASQQQTTDVRYTAFGTEQSYNGSLNTFGWNGKSQYQKDRESGLMLLGHRYYDQSTGLVPNH